MCRERYDRRMKEKGKKKRSALRDINVTGGYIKDAPGSVLFAMGDTKVICVATVEDSVPPFLRGSGKGWITAEYGMMPRCSPRRIPREAMTGKVKGRTREIQRLIGRSLRAVVDLEALGEKTIVIDCDVLQADGGTRTASINGAYIALAGALRASRLEKALKGMVAAVSVGIVGGRIVLDLDYQADSSAQVDMNVVMNERGEYIEVQGTAEGEPFSGEQLDLMLKTAASGIRKILRIQKKEIARG